MSSSEKKPKKPRPKKKTEKKPKDERTLVTKREASRIMGISEQTLSNRGFTIAKRLAGVGLYDIREIVQDQLRRMKEGSANAAVDKERMRLISAQADKFTLKNAQTKGELIHIDDILEMWEQHIHSAKTKLRGATKTMALVVVEGNSPHKNAKLMLGEVDKALKELDIDTREYKKAASRRLRASVETASLDNA